MIQVSTPTDLSPQQAPNMSLGSPQESAACNSGDIDKLSGNWGDNAQKKGMLGIFAKLLDGLIAKGKNELNLEETSGSESAVQSLKGQLNNAIKPEGLEFSGEESNSNAVLALFGLNSEAKPHWNCFLRRKIQGLPA